MAKAKMRLVSLEASAVDRRRRDASLARNMTEKELVSEVRQRIYSGTITDPYVIQLVNKAWR